MGTQRCLFGWALAFGVLAFFPLRVGAQEAGRAVVKRGVIEKDLYVAGGRVDVLAEVDGDVIAAGGRTTIGQRVTGDVAAAGGNVTVSADVSDDVRAFGGLVVIKGRVGGDVVAAGGAVSVDPEATVAGKTMLAGGEVAVRGNVGRELTAAAGRISLFGTVEGDVDLSGGEIEILPTATIGGNLTYRSPREAKIDPGAQIRGTVTHHRIEVPRVGRVFRRVVWMGRVAFFVGLMVAGIVLYLLFPGLTVSAARTIGSDPWKSLGVGFALLVAVPVAGVVLMVTILGIPLGLAFFAVYCLSLLIGLLIGVVFLGDVGTRLLGRELSKGERVLSIVAALIVLGLLRAIPIAGALILFLTLLFGLGAWSIEGYRRYAVGRA